VKASLEKKELPEAKKKRFAEEYKLNDKDIAFLSSGIAIADFFEDVVKEYNEPQDVCNWIKGEVMMHVKERGIDIAGLGLEPSKLAEIIRLAKNCVISDLAAKDVLRIHIETGEDPMKIVRERALEQVSDEGELEGVVSRVIEENPKSANDFKGGKTNALSFLVGQVMKETKGKANPKLVGEMLKKKFKP